MALSAGAGLAGARASVRATYVIYLVRLHVTARVMRDIVGNFRRVGVLAARLVRVIAADHVVLGSLG